MKTQLAAALPSHLTPDRFCRVMLNALLKTPKIAECSEASIIQCMMNLSAVGLEPDGRHAHLIPYGKDLTLIIDFKGYVQLISRMGLVAQADKVCKNDFFEHVDGVVKHSPRYDGPRGEAYAYYAYVKHPNGQRSYEVMSREDVDRIRARSRSGNNGPWVTDYDEMAKKTVFRRLVKWLPISPEIRDVLERDDEEYTPQVRSLTPVTSLSDALADEIEGTLGPSVIEAESTPVETPPAPAATDSKLVTQGYWKDLLAKATTEDELNNINADADSLNIPDALKKWVATQVAVSKKALK